MHIYIADGGNFFFVVIVSPRNIFLVVIISGDSSLIWMSEEVFFFSNTKSSLLLQSWEGLIGKVTFPWRITITTAEAQIHTTNSLRVLHTAKRRRQRIFQKTDFKNRKQKRFNQGRTPPASHPPALPKSKVAAFFAHYAAGGIRTHDLLLTRLYFISFSTYYTKPNVNFLFEALNEFKLKNCPL